MATPDPPARVEEGGAARNTWLALLTQLSTAAFTAALTIFLVRELGPRDFGLFSLAVSVGALVMLPSDFGISGSAARFAAERRDDWPAVAALLSDALRLKLAISGAVSLALIVLAGPIADAYGEPALAWPIRWIAIVVVAQSLVAFYRYAFNALRDAKFGLKLVFSESAMECAASIALVVAAGGAAGASAGRAVGYTFGAALAIGMTVKRLGPAAIRKSQRLGDARKRLARYAGALFVIETAFAASVQVGPLMIGGFLGAREVGVYQAPNRLLVVLTYPAVAISNGVAPRLARGEGQEPDIKTYTLSLRLLIVFHALMLAPLVAWAEPIVDLVLGPGYEESADLLQILGPYIFVAGLANVLAVGLNYLGEARRRLPVSIVEVVLTVGLSAALIPTIGLIGAALVADVVSVIFVALLLRILVKIVDLPLKPLALSAVRALAGAAAMAGVLLAFGPDDLVVWEWFAGLAAGTAAFFAVLIVTGELTVREIRTAGAKAAELIRNRRANR